LPQLTEQGRRRIDELAQRYAVSTDAVMTLLQALVNTNGTMAQFNHPELGGGGQWMLGGMTMVGDMFNHGLKSKVDGLCSELSQLLAQQPFVPVPAGFQSQSQGGGQQPGGHAVGTSISLFVPEPLGRASGQWWPAELGSPNGGGGQNQVRYAYFRSGLGVALSLLEHRGLLLLQACTGRDPSFQAAPYTPMLRRRGILSAPIPGRGEGR
jgi:hypothetical protein